MGLRSWARERLGVTSETIHIHNAAYDPAYLVGPTIVELPDASVKPTIIITDPASAIREGFASPEEVARDLGQEPLQYQPRGPEFLPNYASVLTAGAFESGIGPRRRPWLLEQDSIWIDAWGNVHAIELLPQEYALNILLLLHEHLGAGELRFDPYTSPLIQALRHQVKFGL